MGWLFSRNQECSSRLQGIGNQQGGYQSRWLSVIVELHSDLMIFMCEKTDLNKLIQKELSSSRYI